MTISKRDLDRVRRGNRDELAALEAKCKDGGGTKDDYQQLTKLRKKMK